MTPDDNAKAMWQNQPTEMSPITLKLIRQRAQDLQAKTRRELVSNIAVALIAITISIGGVLQTRNPFLMSLFGLALVWSVAGQYFLHRGLWAAMAPGDAARSTGLEFYRREVERRSSLFQRLLRWSFGPVVLSICCLILALAGVAMASGVVPRMIPFCALFGLWLIAAFFLRSRGRKELQREMEELAELEKEASSGQRKG